jgi:hypothetical protein
MQKINEIKAQIKALNSLLCHLSTQKDINTETIYKLCNKIKSLKNRLKIEMDLFNYENYLSN